MTDNKTPEGEKTLHASGAPKVLSVKRPETGVVRQAFSHGRSKAVVVEIKRPTVLRPGGKAEPVKGGSPSETVKADAAAPVAVVSTKPAKPAPVQPKSGGMVLRTLTEEEKVARSRALKDARIAEEEERRRAQEDAKRRAEEEERLSREREAVAKRKIEDDARRILEDDARRKAEPDSRRRSETVDENPSASSGKPALRSPAPGGRARGPSIASPLLRPPSAPRSRHARSPPRGRPGGGRG